MTTTPTTPATVELLPCPFCGERPGSYDNISGGIMVSCFACGIGYTPICKWNRRAIDRRGGVVTDAMIDAALETYEEVNGSIVTRIPMRAALEAALGQAQGGGT